MELIRRVFLGDFNRVIPMSFIVIGVFLSFLISTTRYLLYIKRKKAFEQNTLLKGDKA